MQTFKPSAATVELIQNGLAAIAKVEAHAREKEAAVLEIRSPKESDELALETARLETDPGNAKGVANIVTLTCRLPLYVAPTKAREREAAQAVGEVEQAKSQLRETLGAAVGEIAAARQKHLAEYFAKETDAAFAAWCSERSPQVSFARNLARNPGAIEAQGFNLEQAAKMVLAGTLPDVPLPQAPDAAMVMLSASPARCVGATGMGYTHDVAEAGPRFVTP
jgi:hypothetical protein